MAKTSAKDLKALKEKMKNSDPKAFAEISKRNVKREKVIKTKDNKIPATKKKVIQWNYEVNQLVHVNRTNELGLIIADKEFHGFNLETNYFFVLVSNRVLQVNGKDIRPVSV